MNEEERYLRGELATARAQLADQERRIHHLLTSQESERRALAHELHDQAGQALAAIALGLAAVERDLSVESTRAQVQILRTRVADTLRTLRELATELRPTALDQLGLQPALRGLAERASIRAGHAIALDTSGLGERLAPELETTVYRLVDDLLEVLAASSDIRVVLAREDDVIRIIATPSGRGDGLVLTPAMLDRIRARLDLTAGLVSVQQGEPHTLVAHIPLRRPYAADPPSGWPPAELTPSSESR